MALVLPDDARAGARTGEREAMGEALARLGRNREALLVLRVKNLVRLGSGGAPGARGRRATMAATIVAGDDVVPRRPAELFEPTC